MLKTIEKIHFFDIMYAKYTKGFGLMKLGDIADILGILGFLASVWQGSKIHVINNNIRNKDKIKQFKKEKNEIADDIDMYINLLTCKDYTERFYLESRIKMLLAKLEYYQEIKSINDLKRNINQVKYHINKGNDEEIINGLVKIKKICERKVEDIFYE